VLVIGGMHRSGTSLTASLLQGAGLFIGPRLMGPYQGNERGHFEDLDFYEFHKRALTASGFHEDGFVAVGRPQVAAELVPEAEALVAERRSRGVPWGWKDPRTTQFLDFWRELIPDARFLFVFRSPWAVAASLARRGDRPVQEDPSLAIRSWLHDNRRILEFVRHHPEACLVREVDQVATDPGEVCVTLRDQLGIPLGDPPALFEPGLLSSVTPPAHPRSAFEAEAAEVYRSLRSLAGLAERDQGSIAPSAACLAPIAPTAPPVLFAGHTEPGFCIHALGMLSAGLDDAWPLPACLPCHEALAGVQASGRPFSLLLPLLSGLDDPPRRAELLAALAAVAPDVDCDRCRVFFDFSNEAGHPDLVGQIVALATEAGIHRLGNLTLICQNRRLDRADLPIRHACFDFFLVAGWTACRDLLLAEGLDLDADPTSLPLPEPRHDILCLNATPRFHRLVVLLMLAEAGIIDLDAPDHAPDCQIPYVSYPGLTYEQAKQRDPVLLEAVERRLTADGQERLLVHLPRLLARTPLRVDALTATGHTLAFAIDLRLYRDSKLSVVTETAYGSEIRRITEKTLKPLALGQPCVTIGHPHSLAIARGIGFDTFDDCLDNRYDRIEDPGALMEGAVDSVRGFLAAYARDPALRTQVRISGLRNIRWTIDGFQRHYYETYARPLLAQLFGSL
jgi:hypothetical protein